MGIGDSIGKAAENAMEDLAGTSSPTENARVPEPTDPGEGDEDPSTELGAADLAIRRGRA